MKLPNRIAKKVQQAEAATGFTPLEEGRYAAQLSKVTEGEGGKGPYWQWEFTNIHDSDGDTHPGRLWNTTSLSERSFPFLKAVFDAFGVTTDTDTDDLIGDWAVLYVVKEVVATGPSAGQIRNRVRQVLPFNEEDWPFDVESDDAGDDDDDVL